MTIQRVDMYRATCDVCGQDDRGEFWAWRDHDQARTAWEDGGGLVTDEGSVYCWDHIPPDVCQFGVGHRHVPDDANPGVCAECERPIPTLADPEDDRHG